MQFVGSLKQLVEEALRFDKKTINDREFLLAYCWIRQDYEPNSQAFLDRLGKLYTFLLKHASADSLIREKEKILENDPVLKESYEDTSVLRREIKENQPPLIDLKELGKQRLREIREVQGV